MKSNETSTSITGGNNEQVSKSPLVDLLMLLQRPFYYGSDPQITESLVHLLSLTVVTASDSKAGVKGGGECVVCRGMYQQDVAKHVGADSAFVVFG
ncbi:hypothetical protein AX774_g5078 [Zancudomyces culisetae]|uniref:Uncharacterized protein n=1 Tax=Zancudomyces culisetae TaxID=1213189 RepID=A0A1R1PKG1_ZANCU|nr:hypothetical protein AX774_g5078 [Zancudomyces culisetae]|eukprot:OMH81461.1 hypothetical protein AX774_g5078 [Zancudomyces culisetae]